MINSPSNPTGVVLDEKIVRDLAELAARRDVYVLSDEVYEDFVFDGAHHSILRDGLGDRLLMASGVSKSYAMTGWRIGWLVGPDDVIQAAGKVIEPLSSCPATVSQLAAEAALKGPQECVEEMRVAYAESVATVTEIMEPLDVLATRPGGAFYVLLDISATGQTSDEFALGLLQSKNVAVAPGITFGSNSDRYVRLSTALTHEDLAEGCKRIGEYVAAGKEAQERAQ
jgi:aspartate aminotransferase/aminotransferase